MEIRFLSEPLKEPDFLKKGSNQINSKISVMKKSNLKLKMQVEELP